MRALVGLMALALAACKGDPVGSLPGESSGPRKVTVPDGPITSQTLLFFLPEKLAGNAAMSRQVADDHLAAAAYKTSSGFININLSLTRSVSFDRAQVEGADSDELVRHEEAGVEKQGIAVGKLRGVRVGFLSGSQTELRLFIGERINVLVSREGGSFSAADMVALAQQLDLDGLAAIAPRVPAPPER